MSRALRPLLPFALAPALAACAADAPSDPDDVVEATTEAVARRQKGITLAPIGTYATGIFAAGAAEISAYDVDSQRLFVVKATSNAIDVLDLSDPTTPTLLSSIDLSALGGGANSVAVHDGVVAVAIEAVVKQDPGTIAFFDVDGTLLNAVTAGALPDMVKFTPDGRFVLTANEGEPSTDYTRDPEGTITIVELGCGVEHVTQDDVVTAGFGGFADVPLDPSIRIFGPGATVAQDLEPEYIAVDSKSRTAYVTLQENNAIAIVDIRRGKVTDLVGLGYKDHSEPGAGFDASDRDSAINIASWPTQGLYMPDSIAVVDFRGKPYLLTANEGDAREYAAYVEEIRIGNAGYVLDPTRFPDAAALKANAALGRLRASTASGDTDGDGDFDEIHTFGARSMSVWDRHAELVADTGDDFEQITAARFPANFNASHDANTIDGRSPSKGPEPEALTVGKVRGRTYAFVGLERISGIMIYDVTDPRTPTFVDYVNNRDFSVLPGAGAATGDLGPEGIVFISEDDSPNGEPLIVVSNEISGTVTVYEVRPKA